MRRKKKTFLAESFVKPHKRKKAMLKRLKRQIKHRLRVDKNGAQP